MASPPIISAYIQPVVQRFYRKGVPSQKCWASIWTERSLWKDEALEAKATDKGAAEVRAAERPYGKLPLIVLTDSEEGDIDYSTPLIISVPAQRAMSGRQGRG